jgi:sugar/nucleoside kinase (ribokinase family)
MSDAICLGELVFDFIPTVTEMDLISTPAFRKAAGCAQEVDVKLFDDAKLLHFGSISLINEPLRGATLHTIELTKLAGCLLSCDPNLQPALWPDLASAKEGLLLGLSKANIVKINADEIEFLTGVADLEQAKDALCPTLKPCSDFSKITHNQSIH